MWGHMRTMPPFVSSKCSKSVSRNPGKNCLEHHPWFLSSEDDSKFSPYLTTGWALGRKAAAWAGADLFPH